MGVCCIKGSFEYNPANISLLSDWPISSIVRLMSKIKLDIQDSYSFEETIGYGKFGCVRKVRSKVDSSAYAVKSIPKDRISKRAYMLMREIEILQTVDHPNIIRLYEVYEDEKYLHLVMELCTGGDFLDHILHKKPFSESEAALIMKKMLGAVHHLHSLKICHRDLKPENFLLNSREIKLVDFGMSVHFAEDGMQSMVGTPYYIAPEILTGKYGKECDIWSLGVVLFFLLSGILPFSGSNMNQLFVKIVSCEYSFENPCWNSVSSEAKDLICKMLVPEPSLRMTIPEILNHEWFHINIQSFTLNPEVFEGLKQYRIRGKLWEQLMGALVRRLNPEQLLELKDAFRAVDRQNTGFVTAEDLEFSILNNGLTFLASDLRKIRHNVEIMGGGMLNYTQFVVAAIDAKKQLDEELMWKTFKSFDLNRNGKISVQNLKDALEMAGCYLTVDQYNEIVQEFSVEAGSSMSFQTFKQIMMCFSEEEIGQLVTEEADAFERPKRKFLSVRRMTNRRSSIRKKSF